jgi:hypothetical protein
LTGIDVVVGADGAAKNESDNENTTYEHDAMDVSSE